MNLFQRIFEAGIVGAGGAGFPTHKKLDCKVEYLIVNGAECEPLLETDKYLMRTKSLEIINAMEKVGSEIEAKKIILALKGKYKEESIHLKKAIEELGSKVELFYLDNFYPAGDEQILVYEVTKRPVPAGGIPLDTGVVVSNVGTMVNIYEALSGKPVIDKYVTVVGEIKQPRILKVPIGISVEKCIEAVGGANMEDFCVIVGGPMMGRVIRASQIKNEVITKTTGALIIIPEDHNIVRRKEMTIGHIVNQARSSCIQCSMCTDLCPRYLIGHKLRPHRIMRSIGFPDRNEDVIKEALLCCECGVCELYACPMGLSPRAVNKYLKGELRKQGIKFEKHQETTANIDMTTAKEIREFRKIPPQRLISRLDLGKYIGINIEEPIEIYTSQV
ncbi:MAG: 4Fe-4S dicluster domain-containing protein, partial [Pseudomonadota bacterium]